MRRRILGSLLATVMIATIFTGCGKEESVLSPEVSTTQAEIQTEEEKIVSEAEEQQPSEVVEAIPSKTREELILENEFCGQYIDLHGYWVNDEVTYYFGSFVQDGEVVYFYTRTDEPDNWYSYKINSNEYIGDFSVNEQYTSDKCSVTATNMNTNETKDLEFNILHDFYSEGNKHIDIVDGTEVLNMSRLSNYSSSFTDAFNYMRFIDLKADENGKVTLTPIEITDITLNALATKDGHNAVYYCSDTSNGYYSFVNDGYSYVYFVVDDSMIIDTPVEEYEGIYYKEYGNIYISGVDEDVMTVNHTEESSYTIFGILGRQTDGYPEGTAVYVGSVSADGRYGHTGNYKGQVAVVLQPNGDVFVKHLSGDTVYQEGFFSKEEGKY